MKLDLSGWHSDRPIFRRLLETVRPRVVFELGTWKGASLVHMARTARELGLDTHFYAIDFWSPDVVIDGGGCLFDQFHFNITESGFADRVTPLRMQTSAAARGLFKGGISADLIYVDADHTYEGCLRDMEDYYPLLNPGGVMFGDDYTEIPSVHDAVREFCSRHKLIHSADYYHWELSPKVL